MERLLNIIRVGLHKSPGATIRQVKAAAQSISYKLPDDYVELLLWSNGAEGFIGEEYWVLWSVEEIGELNLAYQVGNYLPGMLAIGSDGGGECIALDYRRQNPEPALVRVPFGDLSPESIIQLGSNLSEGIHRALAGSERQV